MSFSAFDHPSSPLFKRLKILKFSDIVTFQNAVLMYKFHNNMLPHAFKSFFNKVDQVHKYNTRLAAWITVLYGGVIRIYLFNGFSSVFLFAGVCCSVTVLTKWVAPKMVCNWCGV